MVLLQEHEHSGTVFLIRSVLDVNALVKELLLLSNDGASAKHSVCQTMHSETQQLVAEARFGYAHGAEIQESDHTLAF